MILDGIVGRRCSQCRMAIFTSDSPCKASNRACSGNEAPKDIVAGSVFVLPKKADRFDVLSLPTIESQTFERAFSFPLPYEIPRSEIFLVGQVQEVIRSVAVF
jgi:hypothetical protein